TQWKKAVVTPIPKCPRPQNIADYRPISVTPILGRMLEKLIVKDFLRPNFDPKMLNDQFAYKQTGSSTCTLIAMMHDITKILETKQFVRCILVDFSKAFDVV